MFPQPDEPDGLALGVGGNPRTSNGSARRKVRAWLKAQALPCHICGRAIDYSLPARHPMSFEVDEIVPVSKGGSPIDRGNVAPAHRICNERRGNKPLASRRPRAFTASDVPKTAGFRDGSGTPSASMSDIEAAIADAYGPRVYDLKTEDSSLF